MVYQISLDWISYIFNEIPSSQMISNERILEFMWPRNNLIINYRQFHKHIIAYDKFLFVPDEPHCFRIDPKNFCSDPKNFVPIPKFRWFHFHWNESNSLGQFLCRFQRLDFRIKVGQGHKPIEAKARQPEKNAYLLRKLMYFQKIMTSLWVTSNSSSKMTFFPNFWEHGSKSPLFDKIQGLIRPDFWKSSDISVSISLIIIMGNYAW